MKIQNTDTKSETFLKIGTYGFAGVGKTSQAIALKAAGQKLLVVSLEGGLLPLRDKGIDYIDATIDDSGKQIPRDKRAERVKSIYQYLMTPEARAKYDTVFIDSMSEIAECVLDAVKIAYPDPKQALPMWGEYGTRVRDCIKSFRDLPGYHVVMTVLATQEKDDVGRKYAGLSMSGSIAQKFPGMLDVLLYLRAKPDGEREFVCQPVDGIIAKDRSNKLAKVEPADLGAIFKKILS